jgi:glycosyltransferase involved in cell wall biosynthesis
MRDGVTRPRILFVAANHPAIRPGGAERHALEVFEGVREGGRFDAKLLARSGPPFSAAAPPRHGGPITQFGDDPDQYLLHMDASDFDWLYGRSPEKDTLTRYFRDFLLEFRPDVVHFQQTMLIGYDVLRVTRNTLPDAQIVYTLHEYLPICFRDGQLLRTGSNRLCEEPSPRRCHECFPEVSQQSFFMRERFIKSHLAVVDLFLTPSAYAVERYVEWGIPRDLIRHTPHGRPPVDVVPETGTRAARNRFGFFGQLTAYKGADVLLKAIDRLGGDFDGHLWIHGANLDAAPDQFKAEFRDLTERLGDRVTVAGQYQPGDLSQLMSRVDWVVVPSIWWETGPLTVLEAFQHGRPVICSDMGGMSEKVTNGVNGLFFRRADPASLAHVMRRAAADPVLWESLRAGLPSVQTMRDHVVSLEALYRGLLDRAPDSGGAVPREVFSNA